MRRVVMIFVALAILGIVSCAKPNPMVGDWAGYRDGERYLLTFNRDMTVLGDGKWGTYTFDTVRLTFRWMTGMSETVEYSMSGGGKYGAEYMRFFPDADDSIIFVKN